MVFQTMSERDWSMLNPTYYRKQADICVQLAAASTDDSALRFKILALEFLLKASRTENDFGDTALEPPAKRRSVRGRDCD
jgi:hypothetical protein